MKYWTLQRRFVLDLIETEQCYQPDFSKSEYLDFNKDLSELYYLILNAFNDVNTAKLPGVIFAFARLYDEKIVEISSIDGFKNLVETKRKEGVLDTLLEHYASDDMVILELEYSHKFNPIFLDYNDFQFLMPPILLSPPFTEHDKGRICNAIKRGVFSRSSFSSGVIQAHLPHISSKDIVNKYDFKEIFK